MDSRKAWLTAQKLTMIEEKDLKVRKLKPGEALCEMGQDLEGIYFLVEGRLRIFASSENGKRLLLRFASPLSLIGDLELSSRHAATTNIESLTHAVLYVLPYPLIESKYLENAAFLRLVIDHLSFKLHSFSKMAAINLTYPVATRFAGYLTSTVLAPANNEELFTEDLHEVADMLGTTYRHLGRVIADMAAEELLTRQRGRLRILDAEGIRRLAGENLYE